MVESNHGSPTPNPRGRLASTAPQSVRP